MLNFDVTLVNPVRIVKGTYSGLTHGTHLDNVNSEMCYVDACVNKLYVMLSFARLVVVQSNYSSNHPTFIIGCFVLNHS